MGFADHVYEKVSHNLVTDILLGAILAERVREPHLIQMAKKGMVHAVLVALKLARQRSSTVIITVTNQTWEGIVVIANPPELVEEPQESFAVCGINFGVILKCNSDDLAAFWPTGEFDASIYLVSTETLVERLKEYVMLVNTGDNGGLTH